MSGTSDTQRSTVVLVSGGLDSAVVLACATRDGFAAHALTIDYGQRHSCELHAAARVARAQGAASHRVLNLDLRAIGGSALTAEVEVPKHDSVEEMGAGIPVTYVPARNLVFLSIALGLAETLGATALHLGVNALDYSGYPDCRPEFIASFAQTARLATKMGVEGAGFEVVTPLMELSKGEIITLGTGLGVDFAMTHSCYDPVMEADDGWGACGRCDSCLLRKRGFADAGVVDPTRYAAGVVRGLGA